MKKLFTILVLAAMCLTLVGCGQSGEGSASMDDIKSAMTQADSSLPDMTEVDSSTENAEDLFSYLSDIKYSKVKDFFMQYSSDGLADEIAVIEMKNSTDASRAKNSLENHVDSRIKLFNNYQPDQVKRAKNALVFTEGKYAVLIISDNANDVKTAFENAVNAQT